MHVPTRLLLVEDEQHLRDALARLLARSGYTVFAVASGAEAMRLSAEHPDIAVVVTDIRLPDMYGRRIAKRVADARGDSAVPLAVVYMSGNPAEVAEGGALLASERFLAKPIELDDLLASIADVLAATSVQRPA